MEPFKDIACETSGYPKPVIEWKFGNHRVNTSHSHLEVNLIVINDGTLVRVTVSYQVFYNGTIRIKNPFSTDHVPYENFTCVARNIAGEATQMHSFYIGKCK